MSAKRYPDLIIRNGDVRTMEPSAPRAGALAIVDGKIHALGDSAEISALAGPATRLVDARRATVMPGLVDAHCHPTKGVIADLFSFKFEFSDGPETIADKLREHLDERQTSGWILGGRWDSGFFDRYPIDSPRAWLDQLCPDRPVYLRDDSGHNGWANSVALEELDITRASPEPEGGKIGREAGTGEPDGRLFEAADVAARARIPDWTPQQYRTAVESMCRLANAYGITGINDADATEALLRAYRDADVAGRLTVYVAASLSTPYGQRREPLDYAELERLRDTYASRHVATAFAKIYQDGVPTAARTAAMLAPYLPHDGFPDDHRGDVHVGDATLKADLAALESRGFTVKLHTAGDRSVRLALDAIEHAHRASGRSDLRHELAHAGFIDAQDLPRFAALNVVADLSPYLWFPSPINESIAGALGERARAYWPIRNLLESGAPLLAGSDWPAAVASMDPWIGIEAMVTRRDPRGDTPGGLWPEQAITLEQALGIFTRDGARALQRDAQTGSLAVGKSADVIVCDRDLFRIDPEEIAETRVALTLFEGHVVHEADPA